MKQKLEQGQVWKLGEFYFLIVVWARLTIEYKQMTDLVSREGTLHKVTKKEFCRLIKHAELITPVTGLGSPEIATAGQSEVIIGPSDDEISPEDACTNGTMGDI